MLLHGNPERTSHEQRFGSRTNWATKLASATVFTDLLPPDRIFRDLDSFLQGKRFCNPQEAGRAFHGVFTLQE